MLTIPKVCPRCGSEDVLRIVYGYETPELTKGVQRGEVAYGGRVTHEGMPTYKCASCQMTFTVGKRIHMAWSSGIVLASFILFIFVGYFAGNATILADSVINSLVPQALSASISLVTLVRDIAIWLLGLFALIGILVVGIATKSKPMVWGALGYGAGFALSAWVVKAWWSIMIELASMMLLLIVYAMLSE